LSWASRDSLLHEIRNFGDGAKPIRSAFEAVGAFRPVELSPADQTTLFRASASWQTHEIARGNRSPRSVRGSHALRER